MSQIPMDRRGFFSRVGLSGLALSFSAFACGKGEKGVSAQGSAGGTDTGETGPKAGLCTIAFNDRPLDEVLELAAGAGFQGVELWGKPDHLPLTRTDAEVLAVKDKVIGRGLEVGVYGSYVRLGDGQDPAEKDKDMDRVIRIATLLGAKTTRIWAGTKNSELLNDEDWRLMVADGKRFCSRAELAGIDLALEMHTKSVTNKAAATVELIERVGSQNLKANFQVIEDEDAYERARIVAPYVAMVHAQNFGADGQKALISGGTVDFKKIYEILKPAGFDGYFEVEFVKGDSYAEKVAACKADCAFLKSIRA